MFYSDWLEATAVVVFVGMLASIALAFGFRAVTRSALPEVVKRYCKALLCLLLTLVLAAMVLIPHRRGKVRLREAALFLILEDGAHFLGNVEIGLSLRLLIVPDVIGQTVVEFSDLHVGIHGDRRHLLCRSHRAHAKGEDSEQNKYFFHCMGISE